MLQYVQFMKCGLGFSVYYGFNIGLLIYREMNHFTIWCYLLACPSAWLFICMLSIWKMLLCSFAYLFLFLFFESLGLWNSSSKTLRLTKLGYVKATCDMTIVCDSYLSGLEFGQLVTC